eukprot:TRINITY_DN17476_c0_g1_i1.p1 TRINITY_DN17476_c0_g1~~TRINITY_DN17476_c0_g1_i1.p1  ORF type:complete len:188 (-),score=39.75 TRINITY_DN17476_c0_g1_i1:76-585(-)
MNESENLHTEIDIKGDEFDDHDSIEVNNDETSKDPLSVENSLPENSIKQEYTEVTETVFASEAEKEIHNDIVDETLENCIDKEESNDKIDSNKRNSLSLNNKIMEYIKEELTKAGEDTENSIGDVSEGFGEKIREIVALYTTWMKRDIERLRNHYGLEKVPLDLDRTKA